MATSKLKFLRLELLEYQGEKKVIFKDCHKNGKTPILKD